MDLLKSVDHVLNMKFSPSWSRKAPARTGEVWIGFDEASAREIKKQVGRATGGKGKWGKGFHQEFIGRRGRIQVILPSAFEAENRTTGHRDQFQKSPYALARDAVGTWARTRHKRDDKTVLRFFGGDTSGRLGALVGLLIAKYSFLSAVRNEKYDLPFFIVDEDKIVTAELVRKAQIMGAAINLSRHLANTPAGHLNPKTYAETVEHIFKKSANVDVRIFTEKELAKEKLNLLRAVGRGSEHGSRLIQLIYRPTGAVKKGQSNSVQPLAFVGKGVTFDTGGLDLKPASNMRLMKKDMAGSASILALCYLTQAMELHVPCDFYLAVAENSVSDRSFRPGDVIPTRDGRYVEIDNTDAEGRLVMADAIAYALDRKKGDRPRALIDASTLTGAMRVAVGLDIAGFFSNDDKYARRMYRAGRDAGESVWRLPLYMKYANQIRTEFADFRNSADTSFGGAISAALFLEKFVKDVSWIHLDMMAWNPSPDGPMGVGGNAQSLQALAFFLFREEERLLS